MSRIAGLGMDLADMERVRQALRKNGEAFALRICTPDEWAYCRKHADPVPHLAARFAAKEAVAKAWERESGRSALLRMWRWCAAMREFLPFFCTGLRE
nr:holo-ACP synthase [Akkermansia muciniphila]